MIGPPVEDVAEGLEEPRLYKGSCLACRAAKVRHRTAIHCEVPGKDRSGLTDACSNLNLPPCLGLPGCSVHSHTDEV